MSDLTNPSIESTVALAPQFHRDEQSPSSLLRSRYLLHEKITPVSRILYGVDKTKPPGSAAARVTLIVFDSLEEYTETVARHAAMRSKFVANMVDHFNEISTMGRCFIVVERGGLALDEYLYSRRSEPTADDKTTVLAHLIMLWIFLYNEGYCPLFSHQLFMQFGKVWRLYDLSPRAMLPGRLSELNTVFVPFEVALSIAEGRRSVLHLSSGAAAEGISLGMVVLEWLLLARIFVGKDLRSIFSIVSSPAVMENITQSGQFEASDLRLLDIMQDVLVGDGISSAPGDIVLDAASRGQTDSAARSRPSTGSTVSAAVPAIIPPPRPIEATVLSACILRLTDCVLPTVSSAFKSSPKQRGGGLVPAF